VNDQSSANHPLSVSMWSDIVDRLNDLRGKGLVPLRGNLLHLWSTRAPFPEDIRKMGLVCHSSPEWLSIPCSWLEQFDVVVCEESRDISDAVTTACAAVKSGGFVIYRESGSTTIYQKPSG